MGWQICVPDTHEAFFTALQTPHFGALVQYPSSTGAIHDWQEAASLCHAQQALLVVAADLLALTLLTPPGEWGQTLWWAAASALACPWAQEARMQPSWPVRIPTSAHCPDGWWASA